MNHTSANEPSFSASPKVIGGTLAGVFSVLFVVYILLHQCMRPVYVKIHAFTQPYTRPVKAKIQAFKQQYIRPAFARIRAFTQQCVDRFTAPIRYVLGKSHPHAIKPALFPNIPSTRFITAGPAPGPRAIHARIES